MSCVALIVACDYVGTPYETCGNVCAAEAMAEAICACTTAPKDADALMFLVDPTRTHLEAALARWAEVARETEAEYAFLYFAGRGMEPGEINNVPLECLAPADFGTAGCLRGPDIARVFQQFHYGVQIRCIFDCLHLKSLLGLRPQDTHSFCGNVVSVYLAEPSCTSRASKFQRHEVCGSLTHTVLDAVCMDSSVSMDVRDLQTSVRTLMQARHIWGHPAVESTCSCVRHPPLVFLPMSPPSRGIQSNPLQSESRWWDFGKCQAPSKVQSLTPRIVGVSEEAIAGTEQSEMQKRRIEDDSISHYSDARESVTLAGSIRGCDRLISGSSPRGAAPMTDEDSQDLVSYLNSVQYVRWACGDTNRPPPRRSFSS